MAYGKANLFGDILSDKNCHNIKDVCGSFKEYLQDKSVNIKTIDDYENLQNDCVTIQVPDDYEIDTENSTFECIRFKKKSEEMHVWDGLL